VQDQRVADQDDWEDDWESVIDRHGCHVPAVDVQWVGHWLCPARVDGDFFGGGYWYRVHDFDYGAVGFYY
jgi:hypothetical protein